jgi:hypothetical protein
VLPKVPRVAIVRGSPAIRDGTHIARNAPALTARSSTVAVRSATTAAARGAIQSTRRASECSAPVSAIAPITNARSIRATA